MKRVQERRWFYMRTSTKAGVRGIRKVGTCLGSWECVSPSICQLRVGPIFGTLNTRMGPGLVIVVAHLPSKCHVEPKNDSVSLWLRVCTCLSHR